MLTLQQKQMIIKESNAWLNSTITETEAIIIVREVIYKYDMEIEEVIRIIFTRVLNSTLNDTYKSEIISIFREQLIENPTINYINIIQTNDDEGINHSLMRNAITNDLPLTFKQLYLLSRINPLPYSVCALEIHSYIDLMKLIRFRLHSSLNNKKSLWAVTLQEFMKNAYLEHHIYINPLLKSTQPHAFNIMPLENMNSVMKMGILPHNLASMLDHSDISDQSIQQRRATITLPNDINLHDHASLYFNPSNPMMCRITQNIAPAEIKYCVLIVSPEVLHLPKVIISDINAAAKNPLFLPASLAHELDYDAIKAKSWNDDYTKKAKCAEILVPGRIHPKYILGAYVCHIKAEQSLRDIGFKGEINVNPKIFLKI